MYKNYFFSLHWRD